MRKNTFLSNNPNIGFLIASLMLVLLGTYSYRTTAHFISLSQWLTHTNVVLLELKATLSDVQDVETGVRGFVITGEDPFLDPFENGSQNLMGHWAKVVELTADNPVQQKSAAELKPLLVEEIKYGEGVVRLRRLESLEKASKLVAQGVGKSFTDRIRQIISGMENEERHLLEVRVRAAEASAEQSRVITVFGNLSATLIVLTAAFFINGQMVRLKTAEANIKESEGRLNLALDAAEMGVWDLDFTRGQSTRSLRHDQIFGYENLQSDWRLDSFLNHVETEDRALVGAALEKSKTEGHFSLECRVKGADGSKRWVGIDGFAYVNETQEFSRILGVIADITLRKESENSITKLNSQLAEKIHAVETINSELETFSYSVSHDLRSPLRAMVGFSTAILEDHGQSIPPAARDDLMRVIGAASRMGLLIDGLLNLSRLSRREIVKGRVSLTALVQNISDSLMSRDPARKVEFDIEKDVFVIGDSALLEAALTNLMDNAWKFTKKQRSAKIQFGRLKAAGGVSPFFIRDNGAGFDMRFADKLFGAFQRLHSVSEFEGTGIGLATVKRIVLRHGGKIWVESEPNKGTTIYFTV